MTTNNQSNFIPTTIQTHNLINDFRIYNIFTRYFTSPLEWINVAKKAKDMGFNTIYLNPFTKTGKSKSLYSISDYYSLDSICIQSKTHEEGINQIILFLDECHKMGLRVLFDLVANHIAYDSKIVKEHPEWFEKDENGKVKKAWCITDHGKVEWNDCAKTDLTNKKSKIYEFYKNICIYYLGLGFDGFRCDVAAYIPGKFWNYLTTNVRKKYPKAIFIGESFMVSLEEIKALNDNGFNYIFDSSKWWNGVDDWFYTQNNFFYKNNIKSIAFPDNHDTERLMKTVNNNEALYRQRLFFLSCISSAFEITYGFEFGFVKKCHVVKTRSKDIETTNYDFTHDIQKANKLRDSYKILRSNGLLTHVKTIDGVVFIQKEIKGSKALFILNTTKSVTFIKKSFVDSIMVGNNITSIYEENGIYAIKPYAFHIIIEEALEKPIVKTNLSNCLIAPKEMSKKSFPIDNLYPDDVLIKVDACGICGSDRKEFNNGLFFWKDEKSGGHEFVGEVIQTGYACSNIHVGDIVCYRIPREGTGISQFGGFSKYVVVKENCLCVLPKDIDKNKATLIEPLACAIHISKMVKPDEEDIAIVGSGPIALLVEKYLSLEAQKKNLFLKYKYDLICQKVSNTTKCIKYEDLGKHELFSIPQYYDLIIECTGKAEIIGNLRNYLKDGGRIILSGIYDDSKIYANKDFSITTMMFHENSIQGSFLYTKKDFDEAIQLISENLIVVDDMITTSSFDKCTDAFFIPSHSRIKVVLNNYSADTPKESDYSD